MKRYLLLILILWQSIQIVSAQFAHFPNSGIVTYERKFHLQNYLKRNYLNKADLNTWDKLFIDNIFKNGPTELITHHTLKFYEEETLFETVKEVYPQNYRDAQYYTPTFQDSKTYTNFAKNTFLKLLPFGEDELLLQDTVPTVKWKYTDEYRNIAGYDCRRANGIVQDSIYVVAFFTNQIPTIGGPELIQGLPGIILGVSIPIMNINMFATKVELNNSAFSTVLTKKKKVVPQSKAEVEKKLKTSVYDWMDDKRFQETWSKILF